EMGSIGSRCTLVRWLYREIRAVPGSITYLIPGTVSEVSATLVARTTRGRLCAWKTRCCSAADSRAYSGSTSRSPGCSASASAVSLISRSPLKDQDVAGTRGAQLGERVADALHLVLRLAGRVVRVVQRAVAHLHRVGAPGHLDDRRSPTLLA